ncbi:uncharacterized protein FTJAE_12938 [Fusarium tjaetaba]|uniref:Uncharacterized protein n=1 Tax=Fusarium tjaetaba TaxID=1567544 RepID=A0A8H5VD35_9HYPO|nr:uncharacterized protein FTJAE_12938 [Fusarium tjaetaba]KAF5616789.1 hypothetical protein FTJAE_12938 [Fusarium tjaetaba]
MHGPKSPNKAEHQQLHNVSHLGFVALSTEVAVLETTSSEAVVDQAPSSATSEVHAEIPTTTADEETTQINVAPASSEESSQEVKPTMNVPPAFGTTESAGPGVESSSQPEQLPDTATTNNDIPANTATGHPVFPNPTTQETELGTQSTDAASVDHTSTELVGAPSKAPTDTTGAVTDIAPPAASTEPTIQTAEPTTQLPAAEATTETSAAANPTTDKGPEVSTDSGPTPVIDISTEVNAPEVSTSEEAQVPVESTTDNNEPTTEEKPEPEPTTDSKEADKPTTQGPGPKPTTEDADSNEPTSKYEPGQTGTPNEPEKTTAPPKPTTTEDGIVTGSNGAVVTYLPEQDKDYSDFTGTTTTTDDGGAAIVIFPGGWFWKPSGNLPAGILPPPPGTNPAGAGGGTPGGGGEGEGEDDKNETKKEDEEQSTKEEEKSTAEPSTAETTTKTTEATTTTEACSAVEIEDCTRTISYYTTDGTVTHTEFGDCPTVASCATGTQATSTETVSAEAEEGEELDIEELDSDIPDDFDSEPDEDTVEALEDALDEGLGVGATTTEEPTASSTGTETPGEATSTEAETTSDAKTEETSSEGTTERTTTIPSTLITTTRNTESSNESSGTTSDGTTTELASSDMITSTTATTTMRTYYPCIPYGGPRVETPACNCETSSDGERYVVTAPMISGQCADYTEFPMSLYTTPPPAPEPTVFNEPFTRTDAGTVFVYGSYSLSYFAVNTIKVTATVGLGEASTVSTPLPTATNWNGDGSSICSSGDKNVRNAVAGACEAALNKFEDDTVYTDYVSRYERMGSILKVLTFGKAGCTVQFSCDDYGIGMKGKDIKDLRRQQDGLTRCGNIDWSNSCKIHIDYCTECHHDG